MSTINIIQGLSAAGSFRQAMGSTSDESLLANEDLLSCGPLLPFRSIELWSRARNEFWCSVWPDEKPRSFHVLENILTLRDADSIVAWVGVGAADQLLLAWLAQLLRWSSSRAKFSVAQFTKSGARNGDVWALGMLNPNQIKDHPPIVALSDAAVSELVHCWDQITAPDPEGLLRVLSNASTALSHFRFALQSLIDRYPDHRSGLGRWDRELLKAVQEQGPRTVRVIAEALTSIYDADLVGDAYLFWRLRRLGNLDLAHPLVVLSGDLTQMRGCEVSLTDAGRAVIEGRANAVELNGIDDWVLGVHLSSKDGTVWYRRNGTLIYP